MLIFNKACHLGKFSGFELIKLFKKINPDLVHLNSSKIGATGAVSAKLAGVTAVVYTAHGFIFNEPLSYFKRRFYLWAEKFSSRFKDKIICVSEYDRITAINNKIAKSEKLTTIHHGLDFENLKFLPKHEARNELVKLIDKKQNLLTADGRTRTTSEIIGTIAHLYSTKGLSFLVKAAQDIVKAKPEILFVIIGKGQLKQALTDQIQKLNLTNNFFLLGEIPRAARWLKAFDIFVLPSLKEGLPYAVIEAAAAGVPIVATRVGGVLEIIETGQDGLIVPPGDATALSRAIAQLLQDKKTAESFGRHGAKHVKEKFSLAECVRQTEKVYQSLLFS